MLWMSFLIDVSLIWLKSELRLDVCTKIEGVTISERVTCNTAGGSSGIGGRHVCLWTPLRARTPRTMSCALALLEAWSHTRTSTTATTRARTAKWHPLPTLPYRGSQSARKTSSQLPRWAKGWDCSFFCIFSQVIFSYLIGNSNRIYHVLFAPCPIEPIDI